MSEDIEMSTTGRLYTDLCATANAQKKKSLDVIYKVLQVLAKTPGAALSIAEVARRSKAAGGPKEQTIRNKSGQDYRLLIESFSHEYRESLVPASKRSGPRSGSGRVTDIDLLSKIDDPALRAVIGRVFAERKALRNEINLLKKNANITVSLCREVASQTLTQTVRSPLTDSEVIALEHAVSAEKMTEEKWSITSYGGVKNESQQVVFKPGFVNALNKVIEDVRNA